MKDMIAGLASKKLALAGMVIALIVHDAEARGWQWWHAISVAIATFGYCVAQAFDDGMTSQGYETKRTGEGIDPEPPKKP
jgi:hypothetical protein